ncbi:MAG TPA: hypothetical protein VGL38_09665 [bacterium]|jgi:hypothetical protein
MNPNDAECFNAAHAQLHALHDEISILAKKSPNDLMNKFKISYVNQVLSTCNEILGAEQRPFVGFTSFDADVLPSTSDVVMMLSQYCAAMDRIHTENVKWNETQQSWVWLVDGKLSKIKTHRPKRK